MKYPFLLRIKDYPAQWKDVEAANMTEALAIADSYATSGVVLEKEKATVKVMAGSVLAVEIYEPK